MDDDTRVQADQAAGAAHVDATNGVPSEPAPTDGVSGPTVDGTIEDQTGVAGDEARVDNPVTSTADVPAEQGEAEAETPAEDTAEPAEEAPAAPEAPAEATNIPVTDADAAAETPSEPASDAGESAESEQPATPAGV